MLTFKPASDEQYLGFIDLMFEQARDYLESALAQLQISKEEFCDLFRTVGEVCGVYSDNSLAGFYWVELRQRVLHLHALILSKQFQGQGIGTEALTFLESEYKDKLDYIELGVHKENHKAIRLYKRVGYQVASTLERVGFIVMRKTVSVPAVPEYFRKKTANLFGAEGVRWLQELPDILSSCISRWGISNCRLLDDLSINLVCFGESEQNGKVVLKIEGPHPEKFTEMRALSLMDSNYVCECIDQDEKLGALLLERVLPGYDLNSIECLDQQLQIAGDLIAKVPCFLKTNDIFPSYRNWMERAIAKAEKRPTMPIDLPPLVEASQKALWEIESLNRPELLLHGDLHHWNILKGEDGRWKAIDPHGVVGPAFMECARFMNNHLCRVDKSERLWHLDGMCAFFGQKFEENKATIAQGFLVLSVLSLLWMYEEAEPNQDNLKDLTEECYLIDKYLKNLLGSDPI